MTDSEKLDLLLEKVAGMENKVVGIENKIVGIENKIVGIEKDIVDMKADLRRLHRDDEFILDEVERVHTILDKHKDNKSVHTA